MARPLRVQFPGAWYHVMNRGAGRRLIYPGDGVRSHLYSLLPNANPLARLNEHGRGSVKHEASTHKSQALRTCVKMGLDSDGRLANRQSYCFGRRWIRICLWQMLTLRARWARPVHTATVRRELPKPGVRWHLPRQALNTQHPCQFRESAPIIDSLAAISDAAV